MSTPTPIVNPTTFTITDPTMAADKVTAFNVEFGTVSGVYTLKAAVPQTDIATDGSGTVNGKLTDLNQQLAPGTWFAAATAVNAAGESKPSAEVTFTITPPLPAPPTGFTLA